ncbi:kinase [Bdellovibrio bacteriovorus]|uniref:diacylglycerol/lipid kinase family protein n=1 Tax=Bdellovibrio bacteriovorus TaxID=959 RepID=UPI0021CE9636|nr:diacylglycerol kinase family protein [Bdellovibrio bacteriovorus]UXR64466.1 kinase [Bdellovibrio bacteriovorus]
MRVSVLVNSKAGSVNAELIEAKVREALFRCDLRFCRPSTMMEMFDFVQEEMAQKTDHFIICGGDGTINVTLQCLMKYQNGAHIPPIAIVRSGTANDLAHEIGVSHRIDTAVRNIFEGVVKNIDVIEITAEDQRAFMLTNGGLGLPAKAAELANKFRSNLQALANNPKSAKAYRFLAEKSYHAVKKMGPSVYSMMTAEAIRTWNPEGWGLEIEIPGKVNVETTSPIVLVNNQQKIGSSFVPAPFTSNTDGTVNLLLSETNNIPSQALAAYHIRRGTVEKSPAFKSFELKEFRLKSQNPQRSLTFFGDGEILLRDVQEITVRCIHRGLPVMVRQ